MAGYVREWRAAIPSRRSRWRWHLDAMRARCHARGGARAAVMLSTAAARNMRQNWHAIGWTCGDRSAMRTNFPRCAQGPRPTCKQVCWPMVAAGGAGEPGRAATALSHILRFLRREGSFTTPGSLLMLAATAQQVISTLPPLLRYSSLRTGSLTLDHRVKTYRSL